MSFNESFKPRSYIDEREVFKITGKARRYREVVPSGFDGPVAEWAEYRSALYDDTIAPVMTFPEGTDDGIHRVSWVYHAGKSAETGDEYSMYHLVCDCSMMAELSGEPDSIFECTVLQKTLSRRAAFWRSELKLDKIQRACIDAEEGRKKITLDKYFFSAETIIWLLQRDMEHPEIWAGNAISGEHKVGLLALILQDPPDKVREIVEDMADDGRLYYDGEQTVRLAA